jgi:hypothetical protein
MVSLLSEEIGKSVYIGTMFPVRSSSRRKTWRSCRSAVKEVGEDGWKMNEESEEGRVGGRMREKSTCWRRAGRLEGRMREKFSCWRPAWLLEGRMREKLSCWRPAGLLEGRMREKSMFLRRAGLLEGRWVQEMAGGRTRGRPKELVVLGWKRCIFAKI